MIKEVEVGCSPQPTRSLADQRLEIKDSTRDGRERREDSIENRESSRLRSAPASQGIEDRRPRIALLSGGGDKPYALGLSEVLTSEGVLIDFIGSDHLSVPELLDNPRVRFLNL